MIDWLLLDGRVVFIALLVLGAECAFLVFRSGDRSARARSAHLATLFSGAFLMLALHAALAGLQGAVILGWLTCGFLAHCADLYLRLSK